MKNNLLILLAIILFNFNNVKSQTFVEDTTSGLTQIGYISHADIDGDGDQDVMIGEKLYKNDGTGVFTEVTNTPFTYYWGFSSLFTDIDSDGDKDVIYNGQVFLNDGIGNFTQGPTPPYFGWGGGGSSTADIDGDGDNDIFTRDSLYINDGTGNFTNVTVSSFDDLFFTHFYNGNYYLSTFADIDNDNDQDIFIGERLYLNDGNGYFSIVSGLEFNNYYYEAVVVADINNDNYLDVMLNDSLYLNDGNLNFTNVSVSSNFICNTYNYYYHRPSAFADFNNDNNIDIMCEENIFLNDGLGNYTQLLDSNIQKLDSGSIALFDIDNDNDIDIIISGVEAETGWNTFTKVYKNTLFSVNVNNNIDLNNTINIYPNPAKNILNLDLHNLNDFQNKEISVYDIYGKTVKLSLKKQGNENLITTDISSLAKGVYFIKIKTEKNIIVKKFVKQ